MNLIQILILAVIQGTCELLPVSSSAHVIVAEKLMGIDPTLPEMTMLLVALHTGTMFAVICYFWSTWKQYFFASTAVFLESIKQVIIATAATGVLGIALKLFIERVIFRNHPHAEIELLFGNLTVIACALAAVGTLILIASRYDQYHQSQNVRTTAKTDTSQPNWSQSTAIGLIQGICLPFRGFSRSGATISTGLLCGLSRICSEQFSFALAVVLTPPVILHSVHRLWKAHAQNSNAVDAHFSQLLVPSLIGMVAAFIAGLLALRLLSHWLEHGKWRWFGYYCLVASVVIFVLQYWI